MHKCNNCAIVRATVYVVLAKCKAHDVSALMQLKTEEGLDSDWAQTLPNTLGRWFLPRVPLADA